MIDIAQILQSYTTIIDSPITIVYGCILILLIAYSAIVPLEYKQAVNSPFGRIFGVIFVYGTIHYLGWVYGLLTALAFLLLLHGGQLNEGFDGGGTVSEKKVIGNRWWVEKILGEVPSSIAVDKVTTNAPGDT